MTVAPLGIADAQGSRTANVIRAIVEATMEHGAIDVRHVAKPDEQSEERHYAEPLFAYMIERENIRRRKEVGEPGPWTDDSILREFSFTNVRRSDDRTTRTLMAQFYGPNVPGASPGDVLFNCCLARFFGLSETVLHLGWQSDWDAEAAIARVHERQREGKQIFTSAYVITNNGETGDKVEFVCRKVLTRLWNARHRLAEEAMKPGRGWCYLVGQLRTFPALGGTGFMAKEVAQDFILAMGWQPRDLNTFTPVGKGARRGLNRLRGRLVEDQITSSSPKVESRFLREVRELFDVRHQYLPADFIELQLHDIQFCLCELDKYLRTKSGDGKPKRRYSK